MPVMQYLDCSTAHLTQPDKELLVTASSLVSRSTTETHPVRVEAHEYGWFVNVPACFSPDGGYNEDDFREVASQLRRRGHTPSFLYLLRYAAQEDCAWVNFDQDAGIEGSLPTFEWDNEEVA